MTLTALFPLQGAHWRVRQYRFTGGQHAVQIPRSALAVLAYCVPPASSHRLFVRRSYYRIFDLLIELTARIYLSLRNWVWKTITN